jgi:hypothetical protein
VFEEDSTALFFTAFIFMMVSVAVLYALFRMYVKRLKRDKIVEFTCQSLGLLRKRDVLELFQLCSSEYFEKHGMFDFSVKVLAEHFKAKPKKDILRGSDNTGYILKSNIDIILKCLPSTISDVEFEEVMRHPFPDYHLIELDMNKFPHVSFGKSHAQKNAPQHQVTEEITFPKPVSLSTF